MLQEELDGKAEVDHEHEINMTLEIGKLAIKVNDDGKNADKYTPRTVYDYKLSGNIESPTTTAKVIANGGLQVNDEEVALKIDLDNRFQMLDKHIVMVRDKLDEKADINHNHDDRYAVKSLEEEFANHNHDEDYAVKSLEEEFANHNHDDRYLMKDTDQFNTLKVNEIFLESEDNQKCSISSMNIQIRDSSGNFTNISPTGINFQDGTGYALEQHTHNTSQIDNLKGYLIDLFYPVGSIYTSMNSTNPSTKFGGTWKQITDRFLYCANNSKKTGGSKKITVDNLPAHTHEEMCTGNPGTGATGTGIRRTWYEDYPNLLSLPTGIKTGSTGKGTDYMPPYITVYAWYRTA